MFWCFLVTPKWPLLLVILVITEMLIIFVILVFLVIPVMLVFLVIKAGHSECSGVFGNSRMDVTPCHSGNHRNANNFCHSGVSGNSSIAWISCYLGWPF